MLHQKMPQGMACSRNCPQLLGTDWPLQAATWAQDQLSDLISGTEGVLGLPCGQLTLLLWYVALST